MTVFSEEDERAEGAETGASDLEDVQGAIREAEYEQKHGKLERIVEEEPGADGEHKEEDEQQLDEEGE